MADAAENIVFTAMSNKEKPPRFLTFWIGTKNQMESILFSYGFLSGKTRAPEDLADPARWETFFKSCVIQSRDKFIEISSRLEDGRKVIVSFDLRRPHFPMEVQTEGSQGFCINKVLKIKQVGEVIIPIEVVGMLNGKKTNECKVFEDTITVGGNPEIIFPKMEDADFLRNDDSDEIIRP